MTGQQSCSLKDKGYIVIGTDTGIGKTYFTACLTIKLLQQGLAVQPIKLLASGAEKTAAGVLKNEDAELFETVTKGQISYHNINPLCYEKAIAPHIAANLAGAALSSDKLMAALQQCQLPDQDAYLLEGIGGLMVPVSEQETFLDFTKRCNWPVILVVGLKLGCLNHALLTQNALQQAGISCLGWVANTIEPNMPYLNDNIETLKRYLKMPMLGQMPFMTDFLAEAESVAQALKIDFCLQVAHECTA